VQGLKRRVVYVGLYEAIAIALSAVVFAASSGQDMTSSTLLAVATSTTAVVWNLLFNLMFEAWESRQTVKGRSVRRRVAHAIGFEGGLGVFLIPLVSWWLDVSLWHAVVLNAGLMVFFLIYTYVFAWCFDRIFGLPASAQHDPVHL
jgi:uncharacterized membrane protein